MHRVSNIASNKEKPRALSEVRYQRPSVEKDTYHYLIDFCIDPVEFGFFCEDSGSCKKFQGFDAFNKYFDTLVPNEGVSSLPNVWDGHYRIPLVQLHSEDDPEQLKTRLESFLPSSAVTQIPEAPFRSRQLALNSSHSYQLGKGFRCAPIALYVTASNDLLFESFIKEIKRRIHFTEWKETPRSELHMNICLYEDSRGTGDELEWTWNRIRTLALPEKVVQYPIVFSHTRLEIIPSRRDCRRLYQQQRYEKWWLGATELDEVCSECHTFIGKRNWRGVCRKCGKYESIKPIWYKDFSSTIEPDEIESNSLEEQNLFKFVHNRTSWREKNRIDDTLTVALWNLDESTDTDFKDIQTFLMETFLKNSCSDLFFVQNSNETHQILINGRSYTYQALMKQAGIYYDSAKLELVTLIDINDLDLAVKKAISRESAQMDTTLCSQEYAILFRRRHTEHEKKKITMQHDRSSAYSFVVMSYNIPVSYPEELQKEVADSFWKCISHIYKRIRPTSTSMFPLLLAVNNGIRTLRMKDHKLPETWVYCKDENENKKEAANEDFLCYRDSDAHPKMLMNSLRYFGHASKYNYTKEQWKELKALCDQKYADLSTITNQQFRMAFLGFKL